jgi:hypothetical protein
MIVRKVDIAVGYQRILRMSTLLTIRFHHIFLRNPRPGVSAANLRVPALRGCSPHQPDCAKAGAPDAHRANNWA